MEYAAGERFPGTQYKAVKLLSAGGYGAVYVAEHLYTKAQACFKILHAGLVGTDAERRMRIEAETLARLNHPNIVIERDGGVTDEDPPRPYLVMELLRGKSLEDVLRKKGQLPVWQTVAILLDILAGLDAAHAAGVVHRDIKPANLFLYTDMATGQTRTKVVDFGIAHMLHEHQRITGELFLGTFRWAAPEQLAGKRPTVRTDLYSVGLVAYRCLRGRGPFPRPNQALFEEAPPLSKFLPSSTLPPALDALISSMIAKEPEARPESAHAVRAALYDIQQELEDRTEPTPVSLPPETASFATTSVSRIVPVTQPLIHRGQLGDPTGPMSSEVDRRASTATSDPRQKIFYDSENLPHLHRLPQTTGTVPPGGYGLCDLPPASIPVSWPWPEPSAIQPPILRFDARRRATAILAFSVVLGAVLTFAGIVLVVVTRNKIQNSAQQSSSVVDR